MLLSPESTFDLFNFFPNIFSKNLSCQTRGAAYLRLQLIRWCLRYTKFLGLYLVMSSHWNITLAKLLVKKIKNDRYNGHRQIRLTHARVSCDLNWVQQQPKHVCSYIDIWTCWRKFRRNAAVLLCWRLPKQLR